MPTNPINDNHNALPVSAASDASQEFLDIQITHVLESLPTPRIPAGFAARVASQVPADRLITVKPTHYGRNAAIVCFIALLAALFVLVPHARNNSLSWLSVQGILCVQFALLAAWLTTRRVLTFFR